MKTRLSIIVAAVALLAAGCHRLNRQIDALTVYPTTAEDVAKVAKDHHSDAALVVTKADTQYVLYRENSVYSRRDGVRRCFAMRYVSQHRCRHDFSGRGGEFRLEEPEQPVMLVHNGDNALTLTVDSIVIAVADIATDSATTFRFGIGEPDRTATLYFYGNESRPQEPFGEPTIQQILALALTMDDLMADWEADTDTGLVEATDALEEASLALEAAEEELVESADAIRAFGCYAEYSRMDSIAHALGFTEKKAVTHGDSHLKYVASGGKGGSKACRERMERMSEAAKDCHCKRYSVKHMGFSHRKCRFTIEW